MRIRVIRSPTEACIDGIQLDRYVSGQVYDVGRSLAALFLAEGWAEPIAPEDPAAGRDEFGSDVDISIPPNLQREIYPPYYDGPPSLARDRRRRRRRR